MKYVERNLLDSSKWKTCWNMTNRLRTKLEMAKPSINTRRKTCLWVICHVLLYKFKQTGTRETQNYNKSSQYLEKTSHAWSTVQYLREFSNFYFHTRHYFQLTLSYAIVHDDHSMQCGARILASRLVVKKESTVTKKYFATILICVIQICMYGYTCTCMHAKCSYAF